MKATYEGFVQFVNAQPRKRGINHSSWCRCAVGDYYRKLNPEAEGSGFLQLDDFAFKLFGQKRRDVYEALNSNGLEGIVYDWNKTVSCNVDLETYGDLADFLVDPQQAIIDTAEEE